MKANYEDKIPQKTTEVALGNLYDVNKQMMEAVEPLTSDGIGAALTALTDWFEYSHPAEKYYMLLCHEMRDYTLFNLDKTGSWRNMPHAHCAIAASDVLDCMANRGMLLSVEQQEDGAWELWIKNETGVFAYYLFPYGEAVLEY